jgi:transcription antitermination factor NusG
VEQSDPSEDGKALQKIAHRRVRFERDSMPDVLPDARCAAKWFAVYTTSRHEKRVAQYFSQREIEYFLPLYRVQHKWSDGSRVTLELPLFPGYIFVHIARNERTRVLNVPGALAVVGGTGGEPAPLPETDIEVLRTGLHLRPVEPYPLLTVGQRARICCGALAGLEGIVVRNKNRCRVVITLENIMQSMAVEVSSGDLEPVTA